MSQKPITIESYKSNPLHRGVTNKSALARPLNDSNNNFNANTLALGGGGPAAEMGGTLTAFAVDPRQTRTGFNAMSANRQRLGDSIIHNSSVGKHSFMATPMIDNAPAESGGAGQRFEFRRREKSKEIQKQVFTHYSPSHIQTFD